MQKELTYALFNSDQKILYLCDSSFQNPCITQYYISYSIYSIPSPHGYTVIITREILGSLYKHFGKKKQTPKCLISVLQLSAWDSNFILNKNFFCFSTYEKTQTGYAASCIGSNLKHIQKHLKAKQMWLKTTQDSW